MKDNDRPPMIIDFRFGPKEHRCSGVWNWRGRNAGGHDIFWCEGGHWGIDRIYASEDSSHRCKPECATVEIAEEKPK
jgi:hypothetical protein